MRTSFLTNNAKLLPQRGKNEEMKKLEKALESRLGGGIGTKEVFKLQLNQVLAKFVAKHEISLLDGRRV